MTRIEIAEHIETMFDGAPCSRATLIAGATDASARPELVALLEMLPDRQYLGLRELWSYLRDVPVSDEDLAAGGVAR